MITTTNDLLETLKSFKIEKFNIYESISEPYVMRVTFFMVRWYRLILKWRIRRAKRHIETNKPAMAIFYYKSMPTTGI